MQKVDGMFILMEQRFRMTKYHVIFSLAVFYRRFEVTVKSSDLVCKSVLSRRPSSENTVPPTSFRQHRSIRFWNEKSSFRAFTMVIVGIILVLLVVLFSS